MVDDFLRICRQVQHQKVVAIFVSLSTLNPSDYSTNTKELEYLSNIGQKRRQLFFLTGILGRANNWFKYLSPFYWKLKNLSYWIIHIPMFPDQLWMILYNPGIKVEGRVWGHIIYSQLTHQITEANTVHNKVQLWLMENNAYVHSVIIKILLYKEYVGT